MRIRRTVLAGTTAATALLAVLAPLAPATAASHTTRDARGDVVRYDVTYDEKTDDFSESTTVDPKRTEGDVAWMRVNHLPRKVALTMHYTELTRPTGDRVAFHGFSLKTNKNRYYNLSLLADRHHLQGQRELARGNGKTLRCRGVRTHIDYTANTVTASIPRSCLSSPRWVRVAGYGGSADINDFDSDTFSQYADDANRSGGAGDHVTFGPRVRRG